MKPLFNEGWMFDKRINVGNLFTAFMIATSVIWWAAHIDKRIAVLESQFRAFYEMQLQ